LQASLIICGLALPCIAFIVWPTKKPNSASLPPLYCSTLSALSASMVSIAAFDRAGIAFLLQALALDDDCCTVAGFKHLFQHLLGDGARDRALATRASSSAPAAGLMGEVSRLLPSLFSAPNSSEISQLAACFATSASGLFALAAVSASSSSNQRAVSTSAVSTPRCKPKGPARFIALALGVGQFGQAGAAFFEERIVQFQRQQVGIGEIAVIVRVFLAAHRPGFVAGPGSNSRVSCTTVPPLLDHVDLALRLIFDVPSRSAPS
jgi:hypothetical protein